MADCNDACYKSNPDIIQVKKKRHRTATWDEVAVDLQGTRVGYVVSSNSKVEKKFIELTGAQVEDVESFDEHPYAFSITPRGSSRTYYFSTPDEESKSILLNKICDLQLMNANSKGEAAACLLQ